MILNIPRCSWRIVFVYKSSEKKPYDSFVPGIFVFFFSFLIYILMLDVRFTCNIRIANFEVNENQRYNVGLILPTFLALLSTHKIKVSRTQAISMYVTFQYSSLATVCNN